MKTILFILQKEFIQVFRNKTMLPIIFLIPVIQLIILVNAATFEMKNIRLQVNDYDNSALSQQLTSKFEGSPFFKVTYGAYAGHDTETALKKNKCDAVLEIPHGMEKDLMMTGKVKVQVVINAINGTSGGLTVAYTSTIIQDFNGILVSEKVLPQAFPAGNKIVTTSSFWYNPDLNFKTFMVPGILVLLITVISLLLSGMNIVREKEIGTIEQINVTPIKKYQFIIGKLLPFLIIALAELAIGLTIGKILFSIPMVGSLGLVFAVAAIYISCILGLGLLISTITNTQQQSMFVAFFAMIVFILMSGLFTAVENMPHWARVMDLFNPVAHFIRVMRMVLLKGSGLAEVSTEIFYLTGLAMFTLGMATWMYRKTT
jgi:ABC-2 type transport system permease protein